MREGEQICQSGAGAAQSGQRGIYTYLCYYTANIEILGGIEVTSSKAGSVGSVHSSGTDEQNFISIFNNTPLSAGILSVL